MDKSVNKEGIGLGLSICEAIVAQYDGLIEVQSLGLGEGTLFIFSMKLEIAPDLELLNILRSPNQAGVEEEKV